MEHSPLIHVKHGQCLERAGSVPVSCLSNSYPLLMEWLVRVAKSAPDVYLENTKDHVHPPPDARARFWQRAVRPVGPGPLLSLQLPAGPRLPVVLVLLLGDPLGAVIPPLPPCPRNRPKKQDPLLSLKVRRPLFPSLLTNSCLRHWSCIDPRARSYVARPGEGESAHFPARFGHSPSKDRRGEKGFNLADDNDFDPIHRAAGASQNRIRSWRLIKCPEARSNEAL